jgi:hypothetical protein
VPAGPFTIEFFQEPDGRSPVEEWMDSDLTDLELAALLSGFEHVLSHLGVNVCASEWGTHLGEGLFEFRIRHTAGEIAAMFGSGGSGGGRGKVLLRVFCHAYGAKVVLLLNGYDKGGDPSGKRQQKEIRLARKRLAEFKERQARDRKAGRRGHPGDKAD